MLFMHIVHVCVISYMYQMKNTIIINAGLFGQFVISTHFLIWSYMLPAEIRPHFLLPSVSNMTKRVDVVTIHRVGLVGGQSTSAPGVTRETASLRSHANAPTNRGLESYKDRSSSSTRKGRGDAGDAKLKAMELPAPWISNGSAVTLNLVSVRWNGNTTRYRHIWSFI